MGALKRLWDDEDGQSLLYGAGVVVITMALFYGAIDMGLLVLGKIQAQTAADAAAMSASAMKVSMHHTRILAYRAATGQAGLARTQLVKATGLALNAALGETPNSTARKDFDEALLAARQHRQNLADLRVGLLSYNEWATRADVGPKAVKRAATAAYLGNIGILGMMDRSNLALIEQKSALSEYNASAPMTGSTTWGEEALGADGIAGKSQVKVEPQVSAIGSGLLGYGKQAAIAAIATAGPVRARNQYGAKLAAVDTLGYNINWYTIQLLAIGEGGR